MTTTLFWFRRDLRTRDNVGLHQARTGSDRLLTVFVVDPTHSAWKHHCGDRLHFKLGCVSALRESIRRKGGELIVRTGDAGEVLPDLCRAEDVDRVLWNRSYEPYERDRDERVASSLENEGVGVETFKDQVLFEKEEILTNQGDPYKVFTYYADKWKTRSKPEPVPAVDSFEEPAEVDPGTLPTVEEVGLERNLEDLQWDPDPAAARKRWEQFRDHQLHDYADGRELPGEQGTSKLSPHLRFGTISPRELVEDCEQLLEGNRADTDSVETFLEELIWRDFYHQVTYNFPRVVDSNFKQKYDAVKWEQHPDWLEAWKRGRTGYPIVDAAMRQLNRTGWMHNRLRMIVASFLTKDCMIHWKRGETYFMNRLVDGDTAANNGGWQWAASTGTDAAPYFRIFNPISQSEQYDPDGSFIRRYCPELAELDDEDVHAPFRLAPDTLAEAGIELGEDYPEPILDHAERREIALEKFKSVG